MRVAAIVLALAGAAVGGWMAAFQWGDHNIYPYLTIAISLIGAVAGLLLLTRWKVTPWLLLAVAVLGAIPDSMLWEGAGTFFLVSALMGFSVRNQAKGA